MSGRGNPRRATIGMIAAEAGVSVASVSYALNDKPGLSERTRQKILEVAARHDWAPNSRAQNLSRSGTDVIGLVVPAATELLRDETFWMLFISGLEAELRKHQISLLMHVEPQLERELEIYRTWKRRGVVDLVVVLDLAPEDRRIDLLEELGLPYVLGGRPEPDGGANYANAPDVEDMEQLVEALAADGCRSFARVAGDEHMVIVADRTRAFDAALAARGLENIGTVHGRFSAEEAAELSLQLMQGPRVPDVIVYDSDLLAVIGMRALLERGHRVPEDVQIAAFDDSVLCRLVTPAITALSRDAHVFGRLVGRLALEHLDAEDRLVLTAPRGVLQRRDSTRRRVH